MENQQKQPNKYIEYIRNNKYNVYFTAAIAALLILIISMIIIVTSTSSNKNTSSNTVKTPTSSIQQSNSQNPQSINTVSPSITTVSITTPNPTESATIDTQTQPQISPNVAVTYTVSNITKYGNDWGIMTINNPTTGNGTVIIKNVNGSWKVVAGPGTYFPQQQLISIGAPQQLINHFTNPPAPSTNISPSPTPVPGDLQ